MSLTTCIRRAGKNLNAEDKNAILEAARVNRKAGMSADDAAKAAVRARLEEVQALLAAEGGNAATLPGSAPTLRERAEAMAAKPKVYKTRAAAEAEKNGNTMRLRKVQGGYILRPATDKELQEAERNGRRLAGGGVDVERDSLLVAIAKLGGLSMRERSDTIGEGNRNIGGKMLFRQDGRPLDDIARNALREYGYVPASEVASDGGVRWLRDAIKSEFMGSQQYWSEQGTDAIMRREQEEAFQAERQEESSLSDFDADDLQSSGYTAASPEIQALTEGLIAEAEALGIDTEGIREDTAKANESATEDAYHAAVQEAISQAIRQARGATGAGNAGAASRSGQDRGAADGEASQEGLTAPTPESLREADERRRAAERADAAEQRRLADRRRADAERDEFVLTGSDRPADVAAGAGQGGLFDAPAAPAQPAAPLETWQMTREAYFNDPAKVRRDVSVGQSAGQWRISYDYDAPGGAGPFKGSATVDAKPSVGDSFAAPFGRATIRSVSRAKDAAPAMDVGDLLDLGKAFHRRAVEQALADGQPVPAEVRADYPELAPSASPPAQQTEPSAPAPAEPQSWHTPLPEQGEPSTDQDRTYQSNPKSEIDARKVVARLAREAMDAITRVQMTNISVSGMTLYPWVLPAQGNRNGVVRLLPEDQQPGGDWQRVGTEPINVGGQRERAIDQLIGRLGSAPVLATATAPTLKQRADSMRRKPEGEAAEPSETANKRRSIPKASVLTPGGSIKAAATDSKAPSSLWYYSGDIKGLQFTASVVVNGQPDPRAAEAKATLRKIKAAKEAGWRLGNYRAGSLGTVWVFEKDGDFLSRAGMDNADSEVTAWPEIPSYGAGYDNMVRGQREFAAALDRWLNTLPVEQQANQAVVSRKMDEVLGGWAGIERDKFGLHVRYYPRQDDGKRVVGWLHTISGSQTWEEARAKIAEMAGSAAPAADTPAPAEQPAGTFEQFKVTMRAVYDGTASVDDYRAAYRRVRDADAVKADLGKLTKDELIRTFGIMARPDEKKGSLVATAYKAMLRGFALGKSYGPSSYSMTRGGLENYERLQAEALDAIVENHTADDLAAYAAEVKAEREQKAAQRAARIEALQDPKTLEDFRALMDARMREGKTFDEARMTLTPEQRALMDEVAAAVTRGRRKVTNDDQRTQVRVAGQTVDGDIIATKHTKKGHDLFVVQLAERVSREDYETLNTGAKKIGGYYSSFRGGGAIPGFQFTTREQAQAFVTLAGGDASAAKEAAQERRDAYADDRSQTAAERLTEMAEAMDAAADESLSRERKANTARRARFAASAEAGARQAKAMAKTMRNVAEALTSGKAKFLDRIRTKTQVELLQTYLKNAHYDELRAKYPTYVEQQKREGQPPTQETADYAEFPTFTSYRSDLASLGRQLQDVDGTKKIGDQIMKVADDVSDAFTAWVKEPGNYLRVAAFSGKETGKRAAFPSKDATERAIARSGYRGKAIPWSIKRGEWTVIFSPSEAVSRGLWTGDGDKRITLDAEFGSQLVEAIGRAAKRGNKVNDRLNAPWQFERAYERRKQLQRMGIETPAEFRAALREFIGLREQAAEADRIKALERAMVGRRNDGLDFFPTPESVADEMVAAADIQPDMAVLEPSAGMGHIADRIRAAGAEPDVMEMGGDRRELLQEKGYTLQGSDFLALKPREFFTFGDVFRAPDGTEGVMIGSGGMGSNRVRLFPLQADGTPDMRRGSWHGRDELEGVRHRGTQSGYDRILMNPPFSDGRDIEHVRHAYTLLKPGGRIVALMGESAFTNQNKRATEFREWLESVGGTEEKLPEGSFMDPSLPVNTGANARMVVIDKGEQPLMSRVAAMSRDGLREMGFVSSRTLRDEVAKITANWDQDLADVQVVNRVEDLPADIQQAVRNVGSENTVRGLAMLDGRVYLVAKNISSLDEGRFVLFHEVYGHVGMRAFLGDGYGLQMRMLRKANPKLAQEADAWFGRYGEDEIQTRIDNAKMTPAAARQAVLDLAVEEALADRAGDLEVKGWQRIVAALQRGLRRMGLGSVADMLEGMTEAETLDLLVQARRTVQAGQNLRAGEAAPAMSRADKPEAPDAWMYRYWASRTWDSEEQARDMIRGRIVEENERYAGMFKPSDPALVDGLVFVRAPAAKSGFNKGKPQVKLKQPKQPPAPFARIGKPVDSEGDDRPRVDWESRDMADDGTADSVLQAYGRGKGNVYRAWVDPSKIPAPKGGGIRDGYPDTDGDYDWRELSRGRGSPPPLKLRVGTNGKIVLMDGNHRLAWWREQGHAEVPAYVIDERPQAVDVVFSRRTDQTQTPEFKRWFGDSKVVDSEGRPLVVYHGTDADFSVFNDELFGATDGGGLGRGFYFAGKATAENNFERNWRQTADTYGSAIYPVYLSIKNPATAGQVWNLKSGGMTSTQARDRLIEQGHDGVILSSAGQTTYVAFRPEQIKSSIGNSGAFDPTNADIRFSRRTSQDILNPGGTPSRTEQSRDIQQRIRTTVQDMLGGAGAKVSLWGKTLGTQYAKAQQSPEFKRVFDQVQQYLEDTSTMANEAATKAPSILPKLETWRDLKNFGIDAKDAEAIAGPIFTGTLTDKKVYDDEELRTTFKLTPAQIGQYREFMAAVNTSLDQAAAVDVLKLIGDKNPALRELALTDRVAFRQGLSEYLASEAEAAGEDIQAADEDAGEWTQLLRKVGEKYATIDNLKAEGYAPLMRFGQYKVHITSKDGDTLFFGLYESKPEANRMARELAEDPEFKGATVEQGVLSQEQYRLFSGLPLDSMELFANAIGADQSEVFQEFLKLAKSNRSAMKRLIRRKGTAGFSEDVPRVLASFITSNARMASGGLNLLGAKEAAQGIKAGDVQDEAIKLIDTVQNPTETAGMFRGLMFMNFIGGSIASAVVNLTQPLTMTLPYLSQWGGAKKAAARLMAAGKMAATGKVDSLELRAALARAENDGIVSPQEIHFLIAQAMGSWGSNPLAQRAAFIWSAPFSLAEQFNRRSSFIAAYLTAKEQGLPDPFEFAEKAVIETQGLYNKGNAPNWARNPVGASVLTFKQFSIHYLEWMGRMYRSGPDGKKAVLLALAMLLLAAGTDGLPFADDLDDLVDTLGQALGYDTNFKKERRDFIANQLGLGDELADIISRGSSAIPGMPLDYSIRMSMGNLLPGTGMLLRSNTDKSRDVLELAGPAGGLIKQYTDAADKALSGDFGGAAIGAMPVAIQNAAKGLGMWETGEARDTLGRKIMDADATDGLMKFLGFQPQAIARESEKLQMIRRSEQLAKNVEGEIASKWARAFADGDRDGVQSAKDDLAEWNRRNPDQRIRITGSQILQRVKKLRQERAQRFITSVSPERREAAREAIQ